MKSDKSRITFEIDQTEKEYITALAEEEGLSLAEWIRRRIRAAYTAQLVTDRREKEEAPPIEQYPPDAVPGLPETPPAFHVPFGPLPALERPAYLKPMPDPAPPPTAEEDDVGEAPIFILLPDSNPGSYWLHHVRSGETLSSIATHYYGNSGLFQRIANSNNIYPPYVIYVGQPLTIPKPEVSDNLLGAFTTSCQPWLTHTVVSGETLRSIALRYYGNANEYWRIASCNNILPPSYLIVVGEQLTIPQRIQ